MALKITLKEIAKQAEVSIGTVDRALNNKGRVAQSTKDRILAIAKKGNYSSNIYARALKLNRTYKIAVILPDDSAYWDKHRLGVSRGLAEFGAMGFETQEFEASPIDEASCAATIEKALDGNPDGIVLSPNLLTAGSQSFELLKQTKVPYVFMDSMMDGLGNLSFIGQDNHQSGFMAGSILSKPYTNDYTVCVITLSQSVKQNKVVNDRLAGLESFYHDKKEIDIVKINLDNEGMSMSELRAKLLGINKALHIFIPNSKSHLVMKEIQDIRKRTNMRVVGYDLIDENVTCLKNGWLDFIIDQQPIRQGYLAMQSLYKHLVLNTESTKYQYLPLDIITKENLMYCDF